MIKELIAKWKRWRKLEAARSDEQDSLIRLDALRSARTTADRMIFKASHELADAKAIAQDIDLEIHREIEVLRRARAAVAYQTDPGVMLDEALRGHR